MKKITFGIMLFYSFVVQAQISVSNIETPAQLVQNVLIGQGVVPTNITFNGAPGNAVREQAGHFTTNFNGSNLGIDSGVVMSTGKATAAPGPNNAPNTTSTPTNALIGDADLSLLATGSIGNVSVIEFDFVATGLELNFDYVFASEEYPEFVNSTFNDVFGFFLRGPGISGPYSGNAKNIALVPNSTTPITINNVNNGFNNSGGGPNSSYYYNNTTIGANPNTSVAIPTVIYDGFTTLLTAKSSLICGGTYHIKLAIGNVSDNQYDSAVFLKNFRIKPLELLDNLNLSENLNVCYGQVVTIDSNLIPGTNVFEWTKDGVVIAGETGTALTVTESGVYGLTVFTDYGCQIAKDDIEIGYLPEIPITPPLALNNCTSLPPPYVFNIDQTSLILSTTSDPTGYIVSYYDSTSTDAADGSSTGLIPDADLASYTVSGSSRTIWVRVEGVLTGCVVVRSFTLSASLAPSGTISYPQLSYCSDINTPQSITTTVTPGGVYSENTGGLNIDPLTGAINPSLSLPGNYTVNYDLAASGSCPAFSATPANVTIGFSPPTPVAVIVQPTCAVSTGTITITAPLGVGLEYSVDNGTTWQSSPVFASVPSGSVYNIIVRSIGSQCTSPVITGTMNPALGGPSTPTPTLTQSANCNTPTGTITISSPAGANFEYSNDGGTTYQPSGVFAGLPPGVSYNFTVRDIITGCVSAAATASVNAMPANPPAPTATLVQPTCTSPTGNITITAPTGASLEYSIDGVTFQSGLSFTGLSVNRSYGIIVRDISTGCVSAPGMFVINALPASPATPVVVLTQPTCAVNTGSFTISSPLGAGLQYSIDNGITYQSGASFSGLAAGISYTVVVQDTATGCISNATTVAVNLAPTIPSAPTASVTVAPTCAAPTGAIGINAPLGVNLEYSIDGGLTYQPSPLFSGLTPGTAYSITVRNTTSGCVSPPASVTVTPMPAGPPAPAATLTQSVNCNTPTGTITISSPAGANFEYSNDGGTTYQPSGVFAGLPPGASYNFTVRDIITGCVSATASASVNAMPANPPAPTATLAQPTCTSPTGSISITSPIGAGLSYSIDNGITFQSSNAFASVALNSTYMAVVKDVVTGCVSTATRLVINPTVLPPGTPSPTGNTSCIGESIYLNVATVPGAAYEWTGPNGFTSSLQNPILANATPEMSGTYNVTITLVAGCSSLPGSVNVTVNQIPQPTLQNGNICVDSQTNTVLNPFVLDTGLNNSSYTFEWFEIINSAYTPIMGATQATYTSYMAGNYGVRATNSSTGCKSDIVKATVSLSPTPNQINVIASEYFSELQTITVNVFPAGNYYYQLDNGALQTNNVFTDVASGNHTVYIKSECGDFSKEVMIMDYPHYFTPNGDGYNDTWNIFALSTQANAKIYIFDRLGKLLKEISPSGAGWDGTYNQHSVPSSDYWFVVHYSENSIDKEYKSHFALKR